MRDLSLSTPRLFLSILSAKDIVFIRELLNTAGWIEFIGDRHIHSDQEALAYIQKILAISTTIYFVVREKSSNNPMGLVTLIKRDYLDFRDIGFAFLPRYLGQGYAFEATNAVLNQVSAIEERLLATTLEHNLKSIQLLTRLGFAFEKKITAHDAELLLYNKFLK